AAADGREETRAPDPPSAVSPLSVPDVPPPADLIAHAGFVKSVALRLLRDDADADDAVQDAFVAAIERPPRERGVLRSWLATVARRAGLNARRSKTRRATREREVARPEASP